MADASNGRSPWATFYNRTVHSRYKAVLTSINERRKEMGLRYMSPETLKWMRKYGSNDGPSGYEDARVIRDLGILIPPPEVLLNCNEPTPYVQRVLLAFEGILQEHDSRAMRAVAAANFSF